MEQILGQIGGWIDAFLSSELVQLGIRATAIYFVILWLATAYWAFRDMQHRTDNPILPYLAATLIIICTPIFFLFGVIAYRIIRPQERTGDAYERNLAEEALIAELEAIRHCPTCKRRVHDEWIVCPTCRTRLNRVCPNCSKLVGLDWTLCAWCGRDFERREAIAPVAPFSPVPLSAYEAPLLTGDETAPPPQPGAVRPTRGSTARGGGPVPRPAGGSAAAGSTAQGT